MEEATDINLENYLPQQGVALLLLNGKFVAAYQDKKKVSCHDVGIESDTELFFTKNMAHLTIVDLFTANADVCSSINIRFASAVKVNIFWQQLSVIDSAAKYESAIAVVVNKNAEVNLCRAQDFSPLLNYKIDLNVLIAEHAVLNYELINYSNVITDLAQIKLNGDGANINISSAAVLAEIRNISQFIAIVHAADNTISNIKSRSLLNDKANHFVQMKTAMIPGVVNLQGEQQHKSLLLSDNAASRVQPILEIATDDVACAHGATVGTIDTAALFYLQSRGMSKAQAVKELAAAFVQEIFAGEVLLDSLRRRVSEVVS
jgi:Fe-S cluster assembly scaffold protein SufB